MIGTGSVIGPDARLTDAVIGERVRIASTVARECEVGDGCEIGPFAYIRPGTRLAADVKIGTYVEVKNADIGEGTKVPHLSYVGDADIGSAVNLGASTITANYDGQNKHRTTIGDGVHTSIHTSLVAPVELGDGAETGAGSVVTHDVPPGRLVKGCRLVIPEQRVRSRARMKADGGRHQEEADPGGRARATPSCRSKSPSISNVPLGECVLSTFANGEIYCRFGESIRGADVFVFQTHGGAINDLLDGATDHDRRRRSAASAKRITAVCPFYGYARQDRKAEGREPITARLVADMFSAAGADRVVTVDLHTGQIQGFFDYPVDHLTAVPVIAEYLQQTVDADAVIVAPDAGGGKLARRFADRLGADIAFIDKRRPEGYAQRRGRDRSCRRHRRPHVRDRRRHDRYGGNCGERRESADRPRRERGLHRGDARACFPARPSTG